MPDTAPPIHGEKADEKTPKLAQRVAGRIEQDIIRLGWPVGRNLGSEAELAARYGVGRWVLREAISIAASDGLLEIQRGRYGGLFVAAPAAQAVVVAIHNYLEFCQLGSDALLDARLELESLALRLAAVRIDARAGLSLRTLAAAPVEGDALLQPSLIRAAVTESGNQVVGVFVLALQEATRSVVRRQNAAGLVTARHAQALTALRREQIEAVVAGDAYRIHALQTEYIDYCRGLLNRPGATDRRRDSAHLVPAKRTEQTTQGLLAKIAGLGWESGRGLGSEAELMVEFGVSRAVLREVIRPLERHGVVEMRPGRGEQSGLRIGTPDPAPTVRTAALFLKHSQVPLADIFDVQQVLEAAAVTSAANLAANRRAELGAVLATAAAAPEPSNAFELERYMRDFYLELSQRCGNPVFGLFMHILADMAGTDEKSPPPLDADLVVVNCATCRRLAQAVRDGDIGLSRRHMLDWRRVALAMSPGERPLERIVER